MKKSALLSDVLFTFFAVWIITLCVFRHLQTPLFPSITLAVLCGLLSGCAHAALLQSKRKTTLLKRSDAALKEKLLLHLCLLGEETLTKQFALALSASENVPVERIGKLRLQSETRLYILCFRFTPVSCDDVATYFRIPTEKQKQKTLLCHQIEESALALCTRLHIQVQTGDFAFRLFRSQNALPEQYLCDELPKDKRKHRLRLCFARSNSKRFLKSATLVLLLSLLTPFPYYYLVFGGVLIAIALVVRIFGYS